MTADARRVQFSIRLRPSDKQAFSEAAERCGIDPSVGARQLIELFVQRLEGGGDFLDAVHELKTTWRVPRQEEIDRQMKAAHKRLAGFLPRDEHEAVLDELTELDQEAMRGPGKGR